MSRPDAAVAQPAFHPAGKTFAERLSADLPTATLCTR
jgi:hypothetical protein